MAEHGGALTWKNRDIHGTVENFCNVEKVLLGNLVHPHADWDSVLNCILWSF